MYIRCVCAHSVFTYVGMFGVGMLTPAEIIGTSTFCAYMVEFFGRGILILIANFFRTG